MIYERFLSQFTDWRPTTLYWQRFSIAERYGKEEIRNTYEDIFREAKRDYKLLTELVMVLNHKSLYHCKTIDRSSFCDLYTELFRSAYQYATDHLLDDKLRYFLDTTN